MITPVIIIESEQISNAQRLIADTMEVICPLSSQLPVIVCHSKFQTSIQKIVKQLNITACILCTPCERGTAIALICAIQISLLKEKHPILAVFHHWQQVPDFDAFEHSLCLGAQLANENYLVTIDNPLNCQFFAQPVTINSFMVNAELLLDIIQQQYPEVLDNCQKAIHNDGNSIYPTLITMRPEYFNACPSMEIDSAIFPFIPQRVDIPLCTRWSIIMPEKSFHAALPSFCFTNKRQSDQEK